LVLDFIQFGGSLLICLSPFYLVGFRFLARFSVHHIETPVSRVFFDSLSPFFQGAWAACSPFKSLVIEAAWPCFGALFGSQGSCFGYLCALRRHPILRPGRPVPLTFQFLTDPYPSLYFSLTGIFPLTIFSTPGKYPCLPKSPPLSRGGRHES